MAHAASATSSAKPCGAATGAELEDVEWRDPQGVWEEPWRGGEDAKKHGVGGPEFEREAGSVRTWWSCARDGEESAAAVEGMRRASESDRVRRWQWRLRTRLNYSAANLHVRVRAWAEVLMG
ncbi:hypothetical protein U9M48_038996 [Paspalum notatum var. saurae]|uniref:Uncharacterized protein n=1 Tax=Paspalum notatum var. saurae TaxID=547442 RepID=A0AAQ3UIN0_PASNO